MFCHFSVLPSPTMGGEVGAKKKHLFDFFKNLFSLLKFPWDYLLMHIGPGGGLYFRIFICVNIYLPVKITYVPKLEQLAKNHDATSLAFCKPSVFLSGLETTASSLPSQGDRSVCHSASEPLHRHCLERPVLVQMARTSGVASFFLFLSKCHSSACFSGHWGYWVMEQDNWSQHENPGHTPLVLAMIPDVCL